LAQSVPQLLLDLDLVESRKNMVPGYTTTAKQRPSVR
jgi:hypothetical protein